MFLEHLRNIYKRSKCAIKINNKLTNFFNHEKGVRQGDPLNPTYKNTRCITFSKSNQNEKHLFTINSK